MASIVNTVSLYENRWLSSRTGMLAIVNSVN